MESEFLEFRQRIKESIRDKKMQSENANVVAPTSEQSKRKLPYNDFGSFFGPSQTVIASRVLQETKPLLQNNPSAAKLLNSIQNKKSCVQTNGSGTKNTNEPQVKRKAEKLKDSRDYSFLFSDDAKLPVSIKEPPSSKASTGSQMQPRPGSLTKSQAHIKAGSTIMSQTQKSVSKNGKTSSKLGPQRPPSSSKPLTSDPKQQRVQQRKVFQKFTSSEMVPKHQVISKPPLKRAHQLKKKKKKPVKTSEDDLALQMVRQMFKTDRFSGRDFDDDDRGMEANFEDIMKEEKRSEKLAKKEDAEQMRLIAEEERREREQKQKKQKLSH
ncbi:hypothetical protein V5N11_016778 [Cardamine amara subsp. amara]|uniref:SPT2 chromatin protein n=1 Tax=Cardamine amara subsp. amara TaxID=228776 RepID=A0ABD0Z6R3_CARAN